MLFYLSLCDSKSPQVSMILLNILSDFNNGSVWIVSIRPSISISSSSFTKHLTSIPRAPITIGITVTLMSTDFLSSLAIFKNVFLFSFCWIFILWSTIRQFLIFLLIIIRSNLLAMIRRYFCISKFQGILWFLFSRTNSILCILLVGWLLVGCLAYQHLLVI